MRVDPVRVLTVHPRRVVAGLAVCAVVTLGGLARCAHDTLSGGGGSAPRVSAEPAPTASTRRLRDASRTASPAPVPGGGRPSGSPTSTDDVVVAPGGGDESPTAAPASVSACSAAAARFGRAYAYRPGDSRAAWQARVRPHVTDDLAAHLSRSVAFEQGQLPAGRVTDAAAGVDGSSCTVRVEYADGATMSPHLEREGGAWRVTGLPSFGVSGGQQAAPSPIVSAPGRDEFAAGGS